MSIRYVGSGTDIDHILTGVKTIETIKKVKKDEDIKSIRYDYATNHVIFNNAYLYIYNLRLGRLKICSPVTISGPKDIHSLLYNKDGKFAQATLQGELEQVVSVKDEDVYYYYGMYVVWLKEDNLELAKKLIKEPVSEYIENKIASYTQQIKCLTEKYNDLENM